MPLYVYRREDGSTFEIVQSIHDDALTHDEDGNPVERVLFPPAIKFIGSGFHNNDYGKSSNQIKPDGLGKPGSGIKDVT